MKEKFLLDPTVIFLNHGSFGATPKTVFDVWQQWQMRMEHQPVKFFQQDIYEIFFEARKGLGDYVGCAAEDVVFFPNPTHGGNMVARSLDLRPGDEILTTDHEYGAMDRTWRFICARTGARYVHQPIPIPLPDPTAFIESFWEGVTDKTKVIFLSHITSPTAQIFPVKEICQRAREVGIMTIVDGAHAPGQIALNVENVGADIYFGACHKWMCAPKGAAFLYARKEIQPQLKPLVVSWGFEHPTYQTGHPFINHHEWQGTRDISSFLSVPAAIRFQKENNWDEVRKKCRRMLIGAIDRINDMTGLAAVYPGNNPHSLQMGIAALPKLKDVYKTKKHLYDEYRVEVPFIDWNERHFIRISVQGYNSQEDLDTLVGALENLLPGYAI